MKIFFHEQSIMKNSCNRFCPVKNESEEYQEVVVVFYKQHLCHLDSAPEALELKNL